MDWLLNLFFGLSRNLFEPLMLRFHQLAWDHPAYYLLLPEIGLATAGVTILFLNAVLPERVNRWLLPGLAVLAQIYSITATYHMMYTTERFYTYALGQYWGGMETVDPFSLFWAQMIDWTSILVILMSLRYPAIQKRRGEFFALLSVSDIPIFFMVATSDLLAVYLMTEITSIALYVLVSLTREERSSNEATLKFFLIGSFSGMLMLFGCALLYGMTGTTNFYDFKYLFATSGLYQGIAAVGMALVGAGLGFKIALVPFHTWVPDIYHGAPSPVSAFISVAPKVGGVCVWARFFLLGMAPLRDQWLVLMATLAILSIAVGALGALHQTNIKRLLGYSSIAHMGFIILAFSASVYMVKVAEKTTQSPPLETETLAFHAATYYLFMYLFFNLGAWAVVVFLERNGVSPEISEWRGLSVRAPLLAAMATVYFVALAGIPPTSGFFAKWVFFVGLLESNLYAFAALAAIVSVISVFFYVRPLYAMYLTEPDRDAPKIILPPFWDPHSLALIFTFLAVIMGALSPQMLYEFASKSRFLNVPFG
ncbi:MAG: NADH-quinone oxidoreductase subunit N [bacterium JZ-2024 1]